MARATTSSAAPPAARPPVRARPPTRLPICQSARPWLDRRTFSQTCGRRLCRRIRLVNFRTAASERSTLRRARVVRSSFSLCASCRVASRHVASRRPDARRSFASRTALVPGRRTRARGRWAGPYLSVCTQWRL